MPLEDLQNSYSIHINFTIFFECVCACLFMFICKTWPKNQYNTHNDSKFVFKWLLVLRIAPGNIYLKLPNNNVAYFLHMKSIQEFRIDQIWTNFIVGKNKSRNLSNILYYIKRAAHSTYGDLGKRFSQSRAININI